jgi:hypothetical protein
VRLFFYLPSVFGIDHNLCIEKGSYEAYTCVSFAGQGYILGKPTEYGIWTNNSPVKGKTELSEDEAGMG